MRGSDPSGGCRAQVPQSRYYTNIRIDDAKHMRVFNLTCRTGTLVRVHPEYDAIIAEARTGLIGRVEIGPQDRLRLRLHGFVICGHGCDLRAGSAIGAWS